MRYTDWLKQLTIAIAGSIAVLAIGGCAGVPEPLEGDYVQNLKPKQVNDGAVGTDIRWGGTVVNTSPESDRTCVEILAQELRPNYRPEQSDADHGRFLACKPEFLDPEIFVNGRQVTVVGKLNTFESGKIGEFDYRYPVVNADSIYLWPEQVYPDYPGIGYPYYSYPFYRGFGHHGFGHHGFGHHGFGHHGFGHHGFYGGHHY